MLSVLNFDPEAVVRCILSWQAKCAPMRAPVARGREVEHRWHLPLARAARMCRWAMSLALPLALAVKYLFLSSLRRCTTRWRWPHRRHVPDLLGRSFISSLAFFYFFLVSARHARSCLSALSFVCCVGSLAPDR
jgi:hypothetical protein